LTGPLPRAEFDDQANVSRRRGLPVDRTVEAGVDVPSMIGGVEWMILAADFVQDSDKLGGEDIAIEVRSPVACWHRADLFDLLIFFFSYIFLILRSSTAPAPDAPGPANINAIM
jgi:hypothetical protein